MAKKHHRGKEISEQELLKSDSDDENYSESQHQSPREKRKRTAGKSRKNPHKSRKRHGYSLDDDIVDISEDEISEIISASEIEDDVQFGPNGRPVRRTTAVKAVNYAEESNEEEIEDSDENDAVPRKRGGKGARSGRSHLVIKLKVPPKPSVVGQESAPPPRRSTRATSAGPQATRQNHGGKGPAKGPGKAPAKGVKTRGGRGASAGPSSGPPLTTRRSSRLGHGDEMLAALTSSGRHAEIISGPGKPSQILEEGESSIVKSKEEDCAIDDDAIDADAEDGTQKPEHQIGEADAQDVEILPEEQGTTATAVGGDEEHDAEDEDEGPTRRTRGKTSQQNEPISPSPKARRPIAEPRSGGSQKGGRRSERRKLERATSRKTEDSDEDEYHDDGDDQSSEESMSSGDSPSKSRAQRTGSVIDVDEESDPNARATRNKGKGVAGGKRRHSNSDTHAELAEELQNLVQPKKRRTTRVSQALQGDESAMSDRPALRKRTQNPDYRIFRPENAALIAEAEAEAAAAGGTSKKKNASATPFGLFNTFGPFGGSQSMGLYGGSAGYVDIDSDSSDDDNTRKPMPGASLGGTMGMTPTSARAAGLLPPVPQTHNADTLQSGSGGPANLGKVTAKSKNALADTDPLSVSADLTFDSVGGLDDKIQQLKEMVMLPLMYPEVFKAKNTTPPRGVLFHGPPGTGKTLMARVLAASCSTEGRKVTFYMRKGADVLSKWVGEAERQLRLLFEEARNNQPSILFFDEIDGLAPVRSSKQEQIHASIVSTLLALMDGMDGRGQVVVIGATNRPDAVDPALRRPGRFDREFYFPLPATEARRKIIDIHTKGWKPELEPSFKDHLAEMTKGYGGADLRALCTEAALISIQRTYPQIYKSNEKLKVDPDSIQVTARDFMMSMQKMIPSSERSSSSGAAPLPSHIVPLLSRQLDVIKAALTSIMPRRKRLTALEEAEYEDEGSSLSGFQRELMMQNFENSRVYRPRLLIHGPHGMGQQYIGAAVLHHLEHVFVQSFDLAALMSDATRSPEAAIVQLFVEVKRHKPSVIFIPDVDVWYSTLPPAALATFKGLLHSIPPNEQILLLGMTDCVIAEKKDKNEKSEREEMLNEMVRELFGYSKKDRHELQQPDQEARHKYFENVRDHVEKSPRDFFDPESRPKRILPQLERATPPPPEVPPPVDVKAQELKDRQVKNWLKMRLHNVIETLKPKFRAHKKPAIDHEIIKQILEPPPRNDDVVVSDLPPETQVQAQRFRPYYDSDGELRVEDNHLKRTFYNIDFDIIEERYSNGYYSHPQEFLNDIKRVKHDVDILGEKATRRKVNDILTAAEVYVADLEMDTDLMGKCVAVQQRERERAAEKRAKLERKKKEREQRESRTLTSRQPSRRPSNESEGVPGSSRQHPTTMVPDTPDPKTAHSSASNGVPPTAEQDHSLAHNILPIPEIAPTPQRTGGYENGSNSHVYASNYQTPQNTFDRDYRVTNLDSGAGGSVKVARVAGPMSLSLVVNDASTTTSGGKRTSDGTGTNSQPSYPFSIANATTGSNGTGENNGAGPSSADIPQFQGFDTSAYHQGDSQLPATQEIHSSGGSGAPSSQSYIASAGASQPYPYQSQSQGQFSSQASQQPPPPSSNAFKFPAAPAPQVKCSHHITSEMHRHLTVKTSGYSIEQLEQVTATLMDVIWRSRQSYDRDEVAGKVLQAFADLDKEIRETNPPLEASQSFDH